MRRERVASQCEVIRVIFLEDSLCCSDKREAQGPRHLAVHHSHRRAGSSQHQRLLHRGVACVVGETLILLTPPLRPY